MKKKLPLLLIAVVAAPLAVASVFLLRTSKETLQEVSAYSVRARPAILYSQIKT
jgi:hypothetical protein